MKWLLSNRTITTLARFAIMTPKQKRDYRDRLLQDTWFVAVHFRSIQHKYSIIGHFKWKIDGNKTDRMQSNWTTIYRAVAARHSNRCFAKWSAIKLQTKNARSKTDRNQDIFFRSVPLKDLGHRRWFALEMLISAVGIILSVLSSRAIGILLVYLNDMYFCFPTDWALLAEQRSQLIYRFAECAETHFIW